MTASRSRALVVTRPGDSSVLQVQPHEVADPGAGQLLVEVIASGVNFIEVYQRQGVYPTPTPFVLGTEGSGRVAGVGAAVEGFAVGDLVAWANAPASHADQALVPAAVAVPVPEGVTAEQAAAVLLQGMTAHYLVNSTYSVQPGDAVLVHAAAGGVGQLLIQLAKARGAYVVGTVSTSAKEAVARAAGADDIVRYDGIEDAAELATALLSANHDRGFSVGYDGVGRSTWDATLAALQPRGMGVLFGAASGQVPPFDLQRLNRLGGLFVTRPALGHYTATREELLWRAGDVLAAVADGGLRVDIGARVALEQAARAYDDLEGRRTTGKQVLIR
ncbi:MAG: quinone oxidoreductase [Actinomycetota bacterium]|nr:quinone oxidoreductase [Actinomycetota bacterium]